MNRLLHALLSSPLEATACEDVTQWWPRHLDLCTHWQEPIDRSIAGGFASDRLAWAFATGYQSALRSMFPELPDSLLAAFCVTEETGNRPRDIQTTLRADGAGQYRLDGAKRWTTLGPQSNVLMVAARDVAASSEERAALRLVSVAAGTPGLTLQAMPPTRFVPEVAHARVRLEGVRVSEADVWPGDGYEQYVKPFRTIEDTHVTAAALAYCLRESCLQQGGEYEWPPQWSTRAIATLASLREVALSDPRSEVTHLLLAGAMANAHDLFDQVTTLWRATPAATVASRWLRDLPLLQIAASARDQRTAKAWFVLQPRRIID